MSEMFQDGGPPASGQKVCLATTVYENPDASYVFSIQRSREALHAAGIQTAYILLAGNAHVDDARNSVVQAFLASDCTDLVFLDADVSWPPEALVSLCQFDCDLVGGVYPFRREGAAESLPVITIPGLVEPDENGLLEVAGLPTGFMRIRRAVLETLAATVPQYRGRDGEMVSILFERVLENGTRWGGDLNFCNKWRAAGGRLYAAADLWLGHATKTVLHDSLSAALRRQGRETLRYVADRIRAGSTDFGLYREARQYLNNPYGAEEGVLATSVIMARKADGPIIEAGSGLTSILMAAATDQTVYVLEHDELWAEKLDRMAHEAGVWNIGLCLCPIRDGWYDLSAFPDLPGRFALGLNDGPPRLIGNRMLFFDRFGAVTDAIVCDDADTPGYAADIETWCAAHDRALDRIDARTILIRNPATMKEEAA